MKVAVVGQGPLSWARFSKKQLRGGEGVLLPLRPLKLKNSEKLLQVPLCNDAKEIFPSPVLTVSVPEPAHAPSGPPNCLAWIEFIPAITSATELHLCFSLLPHVKRSPGCLPFK